MSFITPTIKFMPRRGASSWTEKSNNRPLLTGVQRIWGAAIMAGLLLGVVSIGASPAQAESPTELADELSLDGVYISAQRTGFDEAAMAQAVERARAVGIRLVAVAPNNPQPDPASFARRVLEAVNADAAIVFPPDSDIAAYVIDDFEASKSRALVEARSRANPTAALDAFTNELKTNRVTGIPDLVRKLVVIMLVLAVVLALIVLLENQLLSRRAKS